MKRPALSLRLIMGITVIIIIITILIVVITFSITNTTIIIITTESFSMKRPALSLHLMMGTEAIPPQYHCMNIKNLLNAYKYRNTNTNTRVPRHPLATHIWRPWMQMKRAERVPPFAESGSSAALLPAKEIFSWFSFSSKIPDLEKWGHLVIMAPSVHLAIGVSPLLGQLVPRLRLRQQLRHRALAQTQNVPGDERR